MLSISYMGDHVWLITSKHTDPDLIQAPILISTMFPVVISPSACGWQIHLQLVDIGVEDSIREPDTRRLVGVLIRYLDVDFPQAALEGCCGEHTG